MRFSANQFNLFAFLLPAMTLLFSMSVVASTHDPEPTWKDEDLSYDRARRAVSRGESLPLSQVLAHLRRAAPGQIVSTEYEFEFERWVYEFRIIDSKGQLRKVHLDAKTGAVVQIADD